MSLVFVSCTDVKQSLTPKLDYAVQDKYLKHLEPLFHSLTSEEKKEPWGQEYAIGLAFAKKLDLFQAITSFKRANILIPDALFSRKAEIEYQIVNCYYLAKRFQDAIDAFEESTLASIDRHFIAFHDLLVILFESYERIQEHDRALWVLKMMHKHYPHEAMKLSLTAAILKADFAKIEEIAHDEKPQKELAVLDGKRFANEDHFTLISNDEEVLLSPEESVKYNELKNLTESQEGALQILSSYKQHKKNPQVAATLNALLPGAGYLYLGQKQSAFTAFCLNSLFIGSAYYFFQSGNIPAAAITTSFEAGWYLGGIQGAKKGALLYNERLYETHAHHEMRDHKLYPILMLSHGF